MTLIINYYYRNLFRNPNVIRILSCAFLLTTSLILLNGCTSPIENNYTQQLNKTHHQQLHISDSGLPVSLWLNKHPKASDTLRIYIEGDGRAWVRRSRVSSDPTPRNRLVHSLMLQDDKEDTAYIARPCQYKKNNACHSDLWTFSRYSADSVNAINQTINLIKERKNYQFIELIGFSGGATIALLIAAQRNDIQSVRTIAGNLDPVYTNAVHNVSSMPLALNPRDFANRLQHIPQWHFIGQSDPIILPSIFDHYLSAFKNKNCIKSQIIKNADHHTGWVSEWPRLLKLEPSCHSL